ncbi:MAG: Calx-beta domain-containing protein [Pyrinomonadaceae bacterium]
MNSRKPTTAISLFFAILTAIILPTGIAQAKTAALDVCRLSSGGFSSLKVSATGFPAVPSLTAAPAGDAGTLVLDTTIFAVVESDLFAFVAVNRVGGNSGEVSVSFQTADGTAVQGSDYLPNSGTLTWEDGDSASKGFLIQLINNTVPEGTETINVSISNPTGGALLGTPSAGVVSIIDDDAGSLPGISINDVSQPEGNGPNAMNFNVTLSEPAAGVVTVNFSTADGTAAAPGDYTAVVNGIVTFNPGETTKPAAVTIIGDATVEPDENFTVNLANASGATIADGQGIGTIQNDDAVVAGTVQFSSSSFTVNESVGTATITVTRTGAAGGAASVDYATSNGTAADGQDYTAAAGTLNWAAGDSTAKTFTIPITDDALLETAETVNLTLSNPTGVAIGATPAAVLTILDNDTTPEITINDVTQPEGNALNPMAFTVTLSSPFGQQVTVTYATADASAAAGADYVAMPQTALVFQPGETSKQVIVNILGDFTVEPDETFFVNLTNPVNAVITDSQGVGTIQNDDSPGILQFSSANYSVDESGGNAVVTITRTGGIAEGVSVRIATVDGTAVAGEDYETVRTFINFLPNETSKMVNIPITDDSVNEPDEAIILGLESPSGGAVLGNPINAILTILDNDDTPAVSINNVSAAEGDMGTTAFTFTVSLSGQTSQPVDVTYSTADGTSNGPGDYVPVQPTALTFDPGQTSKQVTVFVNGDYDNEANETFFMNLSNPLGATIGNGQGQGLILNDDVGGAFRFTSSQYLVSEILGFITITVQRTGGLSNGATVDYETLNGTAVAGFDYTGASGTLVFAGGQTTQTFNVPILPDELSELDENFNIVLSNATGGGSSLGVPNSTNVFITDAPPPSDAPTLFDYDGDGRSDLSVRRPSNNVWYLLRGAAGFTAQEFGVPGDRLTPADYDGDGVTDVGVFRPSTGTWYAFMSETQTFQAFGWGVDGDLPVQLDRNADGMYDLVLFRPSNNTWYTRLMGSGGLSSTIFGVDGDRPVSGDFDGDGIGDIAIFRPSNSTWYIQRSSAGFLIRTWGQDGDIRVPADYDGDGMTDLAVFRPTTGQWYLSQSTAGFDIKNWGIVGDVPVSADFDGDGRADIAVFRPSNSTWYIIGSATGFLIQEFGEAGDVPTQAAFIY